MENYIGGGYVGIARAIQEHKLYPANRKGRDFTGYEAWTDLIFMARWQEEPKKLLRGTKIIEITRGQVDVTYRQLAKRWRWGLGKVSRFISYLEADEMVTLNVNRWFSVITLLNYDKYNPVWNGSGTEVERKWNGSGTLYKQSNKEIKKEPQSTNVDCGEPTPAEKMFEFIGLFSEKGERYEAFIAGISQRSGLVIEIVRRELDGFMNYWCELTASGKKQKWQMESTFEIQRRLDTWFKNYEKYNKSKPSRIAKVNYNTPKL